MPEPSPDHDALREQIAQLRRKVDRLDVEAVRARSEIRRLKATPEDVPPPT